MLWGKTEIRKIYNKNEINNNPNEINNEVIQIHITENEDENDDLLMNNKNYHYKLNRIIKLMNSVYIDTKFKNFW